MVLDYYTAVRMGTVYLFMEPLILTHDHTILPDVRVPSWYLLTTTSLTTDVVLLTHKGRTPVMFKEIASLHTANLYR